METAVATYVTTQTPYVIAEWYFGVSGAEINAFGAHKLECRKAAPIEANAASLANVKAFDVVYVLQDFASEFVKKVLPILPEPVVVLTGQSAGKQFWLHRGATTDALLSHPSVAFWLAQNPTFRHRKFGAFPYGMRHDRVVMFMEAKAKLDALETLWRSNRSPLDGSVDGGAPLLPPRNSTVLLTKMTMHPNGGRENLPQGDMLSADQYYTRMMTSQYVNSPRGDRPDCYRHWEAIGLGTLPISNVPWYPFEPLFGSSMVFVPEFDSEDTLVGDVTFFGKQTPQVAGQAHQIYLKMLQSGPEGDDWRPPYKPPDRSLATVAHWAAKIRALQESLRSGGVPTWSPTA